KLAFYPSRPRSAPGISARPDDTEATVVCPTDTLETSSTSACKGLSRPRPIARALKRIWASAYDLPAESARKIFRDGKAPAPETAIAVFMHAACSTGIDAPGRARE